jgi:ubiquinone/menaquinone biosynthesis C-methylase UbiE
MDKPMSNIAFAGMSLIFKVRDWIHPPDDVLATVDIRPGYHVLDYGCGTGSFSLAAARRVGDSGKVFALDIHPKSIQTVQQRASQAGLGNITLLLAGAPSALETNSIDLVLLYDIFHMLSDGEAVLRELHRILKPGRILSFSNHHMKQKNIISRVTEMGLFELKDRKGGIYSFKRIP